jgi:N-acyl-D-amino-acid deacylase
MTVPTATHSLLLRLVIAMGAAAFSSCSALPVAPTPVAVFDVVIRNGTVFDGTGADGVRADVGVIGDRIIAVGNLGDAKGRSELDARGRYVTPGFINVHDHTEPGFFTNPKGLLTQGITTAITNPDGFGPVDVFSEIERGGTPGLNYGGYVPFNSVWATVVGTLDRRPSRADIDRMRGLVLAGLEAGAFGVSAGLDYKPGFWAHTDEIVEIVSVARPWRTNFPNHERLASFKGDSSLVGMTETIDIGTRAGLMPVITHMKMLGVDVGKSDEAFTLFAAADARGTPVGVDTYPYTVAATDLDQILIPAWAQEGGRAALLTRIDDAQTAARIAAETDRIIANRVRGAANVYLPSLQRELTEIAAEMGVSPGTAVVKLLAAGETRVMLRSGTEDDLRRIMRDPRTAISCDCGAVSSTAAHPRNWGNYPLFLGRYVRDSGLVDWPEAIRKLTGLPASMVGLVERGYLRPGMYADITVFDPATILDRATFREPAQFSVGIDAVLINGRWALRDGETFGSAGRVLRRGRHEPSRPMRTGDRASLALRGRLANGTVVDIDVTQGAVASDSAGHARPVGNARLVGVVPAEKIEINVLGLLQTQAGWAALTGVGRRPDGAEVAVTLIAESNDPQFGGAPSLSVWVGDRSLPATQVVTGALIVDGASAMSVSAGNPSYPK